MFFQSEKPEIQTPFSCLYEVFQKSCALAQFSYVDSNKPGMVLDIQGSGSILTDPELASVAVSTQNKDEHYFCGGNHNPKEILQASWFGETKTS